MPPLALQACKANRWATLALTGDLDARKRQALVDEFNSPAHPSFVLLLSSKAGGVSQAGSTPVAVPACLTHGETMASPPGTARFAQWPVL